MRLSGEKARDSRHKDIFRENSRVWSRWRVAESSISALIPYLGLVAMNLLHCDHTASSMSKRDIAAAVFESHNDGIPWTTLTKGLACDSYNFCTIDSLGVSTSAE